MKVTLSQIAYVIKALNLNNIQRSILINAFANITDGNIEEIEEKLDILDKEMVDAKNQLDKIDINTVIQELEIGDSNEIKERNLAKLQKVEHTFIANINYGYGTADWFPTSGGQAIITIASGEQVYYSITKDGAIIKTDEVSNRKYVLKLNAIVDDGVPDLQNLRKSDFVYMCNHINELDIVLLYEENGDTDYQEIKVINKIYYNGIIYLTVVNNDAIGDPDFIRYDLNIVYIYLNRDTDKVIINSYGQTVKDIKKATKTKPGIVKACTNIADVTDTANLMGAFNNLLEQMRAAGMMI